MMHSYMYPLLPGGGYAAAPGQQWPSQGSPSPSTATGYQPYTASQGAAGHSPSSPGYNQPLPQHPTHHDQPLPQHHTHQYPSPQAYQQPPSPHSSPEGPGGYHVGGHVPAHGGQSAGDGGIGRSHSTSGERRLSGTYLNPPLVGADRSKSADQVAFSVGGGASHSTSVASAAATSQNYPPGQTVTGGVAVGGATGRSHMQVRACSRCMPVAALCGEWSVSMGPCTCLWFVTPYQWLEYIRWTHACCLSEHVSILHMHVVSSLSGACGLWQCA